MNIVYKYSDLPFLYLLRIKLLVICNCVNLISRNLINDPEIKIMNIVQTQ